MSLDLAIYTVHGDDALTFLQGQLSQDMTTISEHWKYAAHCNPKGRVISLFMICENDDVFYLVTPKSLAETAIKGLSKYVMRSKVVFKDLELNSQFVANTINHDVESNDAASFNITEQNIHFNYPDHGLLQFSNIEYADTSQAWNLARVSSGVPRLFEATIGEFTPEAISLDLTGSISFTKGCYTGQEIVARMHYLGKAKRRLFPISTTQALTAGDSVMDTDGKKIGTVIDSAIVWGNNDCCDGSSDGSNQNNNRESACIALATLPTAAIKGQENDQEKDQEKNQALDTTLFVGDQTVRILI